MIRSIIIWSLRNRVLVLLITTLLCALGIRAVWQTPIDAIPDLSDVQVIVKTQYPGQAPGVVEKQVTYPLSTALLSVPGAHTVRGFSFFGDSYIYVIFEDGTDIYWARSRVLEYLNLASGNLPDEAVSQLGPDASGVGWIYIYALRDTSGNTDLGQLRSLQDWLLKHELQSVQGVSEVATIGGMIKQYQVIVDPAKLQFYDIPLNHIRNAIERNNRETGVSVLELAEAEYMLRATGYIESPQDLRDIPLGTNYNGVPLFLNHVATIVEAPAMRRGVAELNGNGEAAGGIVVMRHGENARTTIDAVKTRLEELQKALPPGVEVVPVYDRSKLIDNAVHHLWLKVGQEMLLVALLLFLFLLSVRSVLVAMITLPIGILISFLVMRAQGVNANIMSLGGIAIAIGAMIDGAIVMIENLHRKLGEQVSRDRWQAVCDSAVEVGPTLFFSLLIITVSFMPVFTLQAEEGRLFLPLALTKTYAMAAAAVLSITLMPVLLFYFVRNASRSTPRQHKLNSIILGWYIPALRWCLNHPRLTLAIAVCVAASIFVPLQKVSSEFMPPLDEGDLMYMPTTFPGISIGKARELLQQTNKIIRTVPEVETVFGKAGRADTATDPAPLTMIETFIQLKPKDQWRAGVSTQDIIDELESKVQIPGLSNAWVMPIKTRIDMLATGMKTPLGIKLAGPNINTLQELGEDLEQLLNRLPHTQSVYAERSTGGRYLTIDVDRRKMAHFGLDLADIHQWLQMAVGGMVITESVEGAERYPISIRFPSHYRDTPERLRDLPVLGKDGAHVRLSDVAELSIETGPPMLKSENARLNTWLFLDIGEAEVSTYVRQAERLIAQHIDWPSGYTLRWSGQYEAIARARNSLAFIAPLTLLIIAILLYLNFRRFSDVAILLTSLPLALTGGLWLIYSLGFNTSVAVAIGLIALAGLAVETGAIMLQVLRSNINMNFASHDTLKEHITRYAGQRLRPVLMTATATIAGLLPMMFGDEAGSEVMSRIAAPVIGGLLTSVVLTLLIIPTLFFVTARKGSGNTRYLGD